MKIMVETVTRSTQSAPAIIKDSQTQTKCQYGKSSRSTQTSYKMVNRPLAPFEAAHLSSTSTKKLE